MKYWMQRFATDRFFHDWARRMFNRRVPTRKCNFREGAQIYMGNGKPGNLGNRKTERGKTWRENMRKWKFLYRRSIQRKEGSDVQCYLSIDLQTTSEGDVSICWERLSKVGHPPSRRFEVFACPHYYLGYVRYCVPVCWRRKACSNFTFIGAASSCTNRLTE